MNILRFAPVALVLLAPVAAKAAEVSTYVVTAGTSATMMNLSMLMTDPSAIPARDAPVSTAPAAAGVPEPASMALLAAGALGLGMVRRRKA